jgi:4-coumarate--CoA ligase
LENRNQVPPAELEDIICMHPAVREAACCGIWDHDQQTELPLAYVSLKENIAPADRPRVLLEVKQFVDGKVSAYKRLRGGVHYLETIPKTPAGKILRRLLPARLEAEERAEKLKRQQAKL